MDWKEKTPTVPQDVFNPTELDPGFYDLFKILDDSIKNFLLRVHS